MRKQLRAGPCPDHGTRRRRPVKSRRAVQSPHHAPARRGGVLVLHAEAADGVVRQGLEVLGGAARRALARRAAEELAGEGPAVRREDALAGARPPLPLGAVRVLPEQVLVVRRRDGQLHLHVLLDGIAAVHGLHRLDRAVPVGLLHGRGSRRVGGLAQGLLVAALVIAGAALRTAGPAREPLLVEAVERAALVLLGGGAAPHRGEGEQVPLCPRLSMTSGPDQPHAPRRGACAAQSGRRRAAMGATPRAAINGGPWRGHPVPERG
mmetsp:Transcript_114769/g.325090  ORF Transcript_114769/g.325090 Transcript_114769/m.325090 type:complete len:265 (+) Transcript_114769:52-846(+)